MPMRPRRSASASALELDSARLEALTTGCEPLDLRFHRRVCVVLLSCEWLCLRCLQVSQNLHVEGTRENSMFTSTFAKYNKSKGMDKRSFSLVMRAVLPFQDRCALPAAREKRAYNILYNMLLYTRLHSIVFNEYPRVCLCSR